MNEMHSVALDGLGPSLEPPEGYYFMTDAQMAEEAEHEAMESKEDYDDE